MNKTQLIGGRTSYK